MGLARILKAMVNLAKNMHIRFISILRFMLNKLRCWQFCRSKNNTT